MKEILERCNESFLIEAKSGSLMGFIFNNPVKLEDKKKQEIFENFFSVAADAFGRKKDEEFGRDVYEHLFYGDILALVFDQSVTKLSAVAFETFSFSEYTTSFGVRSVICNNGTAIKRSYHGKGVHQSLTKFVIKSEPDYFVLRTQSPVIVTALSKIIGKIYPIKEIPDDEVKQIGEIFARSLGMKDYDMEKMIGKGTYGKLMTGYVPEIENEIKQKMNTLIIPERGDCFIVVCSNKQ